MKKLFIFTVLIAFCGLNDARGQAGPQWLWNGFSIYNTNFNIPNSNVGIGNSSPSSLLHVAKNMTEPTITIQNLGGTGGAAFRIMDGTYSDWKFKVAGNRAFKIRDNKMGLDVVTIEQNAAANVLYIKQGGNIGMGFTTPLEKLHINGAVTIGNTTGNNIGTIRWDGNNFQGRNATGWVNIDAQPFDHSLLQDIENSTFVVATTNYSVPAGNNLFVTIINVPYGAYITGTEVVIKGIPNLCYYGTHYFPIILSPSDQITMNNGGLISAQLIPLKYTTIYMSIKNNPYTVPVNKNLVLLGVYADCITMSADADELLIDGNNLGYITTPQGLSFPLVINSGMIVSTLNVTRDMVISGYLIDD